MNHRFLRCFSSTQMASSTQMDELIFVRSDSVSASSMDAISKNNVESVLRDLSRSPLSIAALTLLLGNTFSRIHSARLVSLLTFLRNNCRSISQTVVRIPVLRQVPLC